MMDKSRALLTGYYTSICLLAFALPFANIYGSISICLTVLTWVISGQAKHSLINMKKKPVLIIWVIFFLLHAASYLWSSNRGQSLFDTQQKLSFILLPLAIGSADVLPKEWLRRALNCFVGAIVITSVYCLIRAVVIFILHGTTDQFFYHPLVEGFEANAVYMAWYVLTAIGVTVYIKMNNKWMKGTMIAILSLFFILLSSRLLLVVGAIALFYFIVGHKKGFSKRYQPLTIGIAIIILVLIAVFPNPIRKRFVDIIGKEKTERVAKNGQKELSFNNYTLRMFLWRTGLHNIEDHRLYFYGCGTGDVRVYQNKTMDSLKRSGYNLSQHHELGDYDMHNTFIQTLYMLGIPGLLMVVYLALYPLLTFKRKIPYKGAFILFQASSICLMLQEAIFQVQVGIVFYLFFSMLQYNQYDSVNSEVMN